LFKVVYKTFPLRYLDALLDIEDRKMRDRYGAYRSPLIAVLYDMGLAVPFPSVVDRVNRAGRISTIKIGMYLARDSQ